MRLANILGLALVVLFGGMATGARAQSDGAVLLYDSATGAHAAAVIQYPGRLELGTVSREPFAALAGKGAAEPFATPLALFVNDSRAQRQAQAIQIWPDGTLRHGRKAPGCDLGAPRLAPLGMFIVCVGAGGAVEVGRLDEADGAYVREFRAPPGTLPRYSHALAAANYLLLYNERTGALAVGQIARNETTGEQHLEITDTGTTAKGYRRFAAAGNRVFLYDPNSGRYETARLELETEGAPGAADRRFLARFVRTSAGRLAQGLRQVVAANDEEIILYRSDGHFVVGRFGAGDRFQLRDEGRTRAGFDQLIRVGDYLFFLDGGGSSRAAIGLITTDGRYKELSTPRTGRYDRAAAAG